MWEEKFSCQFFFFRAGNMLCVRVQGLRTDLRVTGNYESCCFCVLFQNNNYVSWQLVFFSENSGLFASREIELHVLYLKQRAS